MFYFLLRKRWRMTCNHDGDAKKNMLAHGLELFDEETKLTEFTHTRIISSILPKN
jgi:hypothetical protein